MKQFSGFQQRRLSQLVAFALVSSALLPVAQAEDVVDLGTVSTTAGAGPNQSVDVMVGRGTASAVAPTQANLKATEPQSIISRTFIEESVAPAGNFNTIIGIAPSVASQPSPNGPGLGDTTSSMRGFKDGEYNVTFDGIPFGDTNDPTHHSTSYFPASTIGGVVVERGPGNASNLGQATYGGSINLLSKTAAAVGKTTFFESWGNWDTQLFGADFESGRLQDYGDATVQFDFQHLGSNGYLSYNRITGDNYATKIQRPLGDNHLLTLFGTFNSVKTNTPDNASGATLQQAALFGKSYSLNNDPTSQGYFGYNLVTKHTDFEYARLQSDWGDGWQTDNDLYTYAYKNYTLAGADPTGYLGTGDPIAAGALADNAKNYGVKLSNGVPGNNKLNQYRVWGDIFKATKRTDLGLARMGVWYDTADTHRLNFGMDMEHNTLTGGLKSLQDSAWHQFQPFAEFEWAAAQGLTVTPGVKYMNFTRSVDAVFNQGSKVPANFAETYTDTLPFLTVNKLFNDHFSAYFQYAKGLQVPSLSDLQVPTPNNSPSPQTTTNYQTGVVYKNDRLTWDADVYFINFDNMIGSNTVNNQTTFYNAGGAIYKGIEGELTYVLGGGFSVYVNGSLNDANYTANNAAGSIGAVPNSPKNTAGVGLLYNQGSWTASMIYKEVGRQYDATNQPVAFLVNSYANTDLNASYTFHNVGLSQIKAAKVQLSVFNVFDSRSVTAIGAGNTLALNQYQWQAPRSAMLTLKVDI